MQQQVTLRTLCNNFPYHCSKHAKTSNNNNNNNLVTYIAQTNPPIVAAQGAHTNNITTYSSYTIMH